jgi:hypothetical protein
MQQGKNLLPVQEVLEHTAVTEVFFLQLPQYHALTLCVQRNVQVGHAAAGNIAYDLVSCKFTHEPMLEEHDAVEK